MKIIIFGAPGSGKDSQANLIIKNFKLNKISTGDYFREEYKNKTKIGIEAHKYWIKGNLVPEEITFKIIKKHLPKDNYLFCGFPRTIKQAEFLNEYAKPDIVIYLEVSEKVLKNRLLKRAKIEGRLDDTEKVIKERLIVYKKQTEPLLKFYKTILVRLDGNRKAEEVYKEVKNILKK